MSSAQKIIQAAAGNAAGEALYVEDVFSTYLYTGNGSTQTITNGIDLDGEGGLVWQKSRSLTGGNAFFDTERGSDFLLESQSTAAQGDTRTSGAPGNNDLTSFNANGFSMGTPYWTNVNNNGSETVSWTFRKAPKFFDVVTWTGTGSARTVSHNLGSVPGFIVIKRTDSAGNNWECFHRSRGNSKYILLNSNIAELTDTGNRWNGTDPTSTVFTVGTSTSVNASGGEYVAYLFAHNDGDGEFGETGDQDIIKCGSFTTDGSYNASVDLGFEPQWIVIKRSDGSANWNLFDSMRGMPAPGLSPTYTGLQNLFPNLSNAEGEANGPHPTATGFEVTSYGAANANYIYIAIRRGPMKTPESGTEVFSPNLASGYPRYPSGFVTDAVYQSTRDSGFGLFFDRMRGTTYLDTSSTNAETSSPYPWDQMDGSGSNFSSTNYIGWSFRRAPGFFDVVAYEGNGGANASRNINHNLGVTPELMIVKAREDATDDSWFVYSSATGASDKLILNSSAASASSSVWASTAPTNSVFTAGNSALGAGTNSQNISYIAYLFATVAGISKVGSYTGNGTSQTIDCGFSAGARFVLIKRTDASGNWKVMDTARGIVAGDDKVLELDNTSAESTFDLIDPDSSGFAVEGNTTQGQNQSGATYIFLAIA